MRARVLGLIRALRARGIAVSVAESLVAMEAVAAAGIERPVLREALATALVKDEADRPVFDRLFDEAFPLRGAERTAGRRRRPAPAGGAGHARGRAGGTTEGMRGRRLAERESHPGEARGPRPAREGPQEREDAAGSRAARARRLRTLPFADFTGRDVVEAREVDRKSTRLNSSHVEISYAVFCLK